MQNTDLIIIGGGAAGLMAAARASELGLRAIVLERKNQPGRKLLMCGNNRCNLSTDLSPTDLIGAYHGPNSDFLRSAIESFNSQDLQHWFSQHRVPTKVMENGRIYPRTERANDVVNCFKDILRDRQIPLVLNCPVAAVSRTGNSFIVESDSLRLEAPFVLIATGGVSYPKTGSVGDGQRFARELGHKVTPFRPGLAAYGLRPSWWQQRKELAFSDTLLSIISRGKVVEQSRGGIEIRAGQAHGPAVINASNIVSRFNLSDYRFVVDLAPTIPEEELVQRIDRSGLKRVLADVLPKEAISLFINNELNGNASDQEAAAKLKSVELPIDKVRPLKEAMVTVGGVSADEINPATMESNQQPGLFFAGEVMDMEGPCGGFNLQAAFATARLAVTTVASRCDCQPAQAPKKRTEKAKKNRYQQKNRRPGNRR